MNAKKKNFWLTRLDYIFVLRPMLFFPGWSTLLAGYFISTRFEIFPPFEDLSRLGEIIMLISAFALMMGSTFVLNQIRDIESDKKNHKLFLISDGYISPGQAKIEVAILTVLSLLIGFLMNPAIGFLLFAFFVITGYLYNYPPARMKDRPWGSLLANALMGWLAFAIGWSAGNALHPDLLVDSLPYLLFNTALYLFTTMPDREGDQQSRKKTLAVVFGVGPLSVASFVLYMAGFITCLALGDYQALIFYVLSGPFFLAVVARRKVADAIRSTKFGILFFAVAVCLRWPLYIVLMVLGFFGKKLYFKKRFDLDYPNFSGK